jgi:hypothetical protein
MEDRLPTPRLLKVLELPPQARLVVEHRQREVREQTQLSEAQEAGAAPVVVAAAAAECN